MKKLKKPPLFFSSVWVEGFDCLVGGVEDGVGLGVTVLLGRGGAFEVGTFLGVFFVSFFFQD